MWDNDDMPALSSKMPERWCTEGKECLLSLNETDETEMSQVQCLMNILCCSDQMSQHSSEYDFVQSLLNLDCISLGFFSQNTQKSDQGHLTLQWFSNKFISIL